MKSNPFPLLIRQIHLALKASSLFCLKSLPVMLSSWNKINKKSLAYLFKSTLNALIVFQLVVHPYASASKPVITKTDQKKLENLKNQVLSLRESLLSPKSKDHINHPLDTFSLLGQTLQKNPAEAPAENLVETPAETPAEAPAENLAETSTEAPAETPAKKPTKNPIKNIPFKNMVVKLVQGKKTKAVLVHPSHQNIASKVLPQQDLNKYVGSVFNNTSNKNKNPQFKLSFHDQDFHTFRHKIKWMAYFDSYLVFLEPSKVSDSKALVSFIDLNYFKEAIGKTSLPIFYIPIDFKTAKVSKDDILKVNIENDRLHIGSIELSSQQINLFSKIQQLSFNLTISLLDTSNTESFGYLKDMVESYSRLQTNKLPGDTNSYISDEIQKIVLDRLKLQRDIGSPKKASSTYAHLQHIKDKAKLKATLNKVKPNTEQNEKSVADLKKESDADLKFIEGLTVNRDFQKATDQISKVNFEQQKLWNRGMLFFNFLTKPQPLGAPKIKKSLWLIANTLLPGETIESRLPLAREGVSQMFYSKKSRLLGGAMLTGASALVLPETSQYFVSALSNVGTYLGHWSELLSATGKSSVEWISMDGLYDAYIKGDKLPHFMIALGSVFTGAIIFLGGLQLGSNLPDLKKHLNSEKAKNHNKEVQSKVAKLIAYANQRQKDYLENLSYSEMRKQGIHVHLEFGLKNIKSHQLLKTESNLHDLLSILKQTENPISLKIETKQPLFLQFQSVQTKSNSSELNNNQISVSIDTPNGGRLTRLFTVADSDSYDSLASLLENSLTEDERIKPDIIFDVQLGDGKTHVKGMLENVDFTKEEEIAVKEAFAKVAQNHKVDPKTLTPSEITTLKQALFHFSFSPASWSRTFRLMGLAWNWWFLSRNIIFIPNSWIPLVRFSKFFNVVYHKNTPTYFNGGQQSRWQRFKSISNATKQSDKSRAQVKEALVSLENQILELEKMVMKEVTARAYLEIVKNPEFKNKNAATGPSKFTHKDISNKKIKMFFMMYKEKLFHEVMADLIAEIFGETPKTLDKQLKDKGLDLFLNKGFELPTLTKTEIRQQVLKVEQQQDIAKQIQSNMDRLWSKIATSIRQKSIDNLNPDVNTQMARFDIANKFLNDSEALARVTTQQLALLTVDKPIELLFRLLILAGVDQGVLQILHDQPFTEEALFYFSRYAIWFWFIGDVVVQTLAGAWWKVQMDHRIATTSDNFDAIPSKKDIKDGYLKWLKKSIMQPKNSFKSNYIHSMQLAWANLPAATLLYTMMFGLTLGRFDLDLFVAGYTMVLLGALGLQLKSENTYEQTANWALKDLIRYGDLDLTGKNKKLLSHPEVQNLLSKQGRKNRRTFNLWLATLVNNPIQNALDVATGITTSTGSFGFIRLFYGDLITNHLTNFVDFVQTHTPISAEFAETCKSVFTRNRVDL